jgi:hypothetical protein
MRLSSIGRRVQSNCTQIDISQRGTDKCAARVWVTRCNEIAPYEGCLVSSLRGERNAFDPRGEQVEPRQPREHRSSVNVNSQSTFLGRHVATLLAMTEWKTDSVFTRCTSSRLQPIQKAGCEHPGYHYRLLFEIEMTGFAASTFGTVNSICRVHLQAAIGEFGRDHQFQPISTVSPRTLARGSTGNTGPQFSFAITVATN